MNSVESTSQDYPDSLRDLGDAPSRLFTIGDASHMRPPTVSIVGTRNATSYGMRTARSLATAFSRAGFSIVSGMARGIDAAVHRAALEAGGRTVAVLGTGVDVPYPIGHRELHRAIGERALVISEYGSGVGAHPGTFPRRNRIIAALSPVTIVVEAGVRSGAINTAGHALRLSRTIAAVPGPIDSPESVGANRLIRDGAHIITALPDAFALAGVAMDDECEPSGLAPDEARVWKCLAAGPLGPDALARKCHVTVRECLTILTSLELGGLVEVLVTGEARRR